MGASKVTFLGGEPTIYGYRKGGKPLLALIKGTRQLGYEYIRLDTNGQKTRQFLLHDDFRKLDEIAFSLDGFSPETNDPLRGSGTFIRAVDSQWTPATAPAEHSFLRCSVARNKVYSPDRSAS